MMMRKLPKYVQAWVDHEGRPHCYYRRPGYPRVPLPGLPWSPEFMLAYDDAKKAVPEPIGAKRIRPGSVAAAVAMFYWSLAFTSLAPGSQASRRAILERFRAEYGTYPMAKLPREFVVAALNRMKPFAARNWLKAIRALCQFAVSQALAPADVTQGIKLPKVKTDGHHTWDEAEIAQFEAHHPIGSKARLALALPLFTCQRRGDVIHMGRQHIRDGVLIVRQQKTGVTLAIPVHPALQSVLDATPSEHLTFLTSRSGRPYAANDFTEQFRVWCNEAGLPTRCKVHGLRKAACRRLAEAGCSANEIAAISGHVTLQEVARYTRAVDQEKMARNAMARVNATVSNPEMFDKTGGASR
jgi:integrase